MTETAGAARGAAGPAPRASAGAAHQTSAGGAHRPASLRLVPHAPEKVPAREFKTDQEVRWCPGCGDYAILAAFQAFMPELEVPRENVVVISGIGCSSRFPHYVNTYGFHSIHGRAPAIATGLAASRPDLSVWVITGDGDALSIGGNHLIHALRRNVNIKILVFNNRIYGLTKGQYSPTSELGKVTKSTPLGSLDAPFNPISLALGAEATFVARSIDSDRKHLMGVLRAAADHDGAAFIEIYQNCPIFNDDAFLPLKEPTSRDDRLIRLQHGQLVRFGANGSLGLRFGRHGSLEVAEVPGAETGGARAAPGAETGGARPAPGAETRGARAAPGAETADAEAADGFVVHDSQRDDPSYAFALSRLDSEDFAHTPIGVFRQVERPSYDGLMAEQIETAKAGQGAGDLSALLSSGDTWQVD